ncbi:MAG: amino acid adenylation domain-containing protein [Anaerolineales bacterium]
MLRFGISAKTTAALRDLGKQTSSTLFMVLTAAFNIFLSRYSGQNDVCIGTPIANRGRAELEVLIGFFVNTLVLRTRIDNTASFVSLLQQVRAATLGAYAHQDVPFEQLVDALKPERHTSHSPLFQAMLSLQNTPRNSLDLPGLTLQLVTSDSVVAKFDLTLEVTEVSDYLSTEFEYNTDLFDQVTVERMVGHFTRLLEAIVTHPDACIQDLPMLSSAERQQILVEWSGVGMEYPHPLGKCIHNLFEEQVQRTPGAVAVVFEGQQLTYCELNERANQLAHYLQKQGVGPDALVGICVERSLEMVVGLLGILKAGGAYVPLDPAYPTDRLSFMLNDAKPAILLTQARLLSRLPECVVPLICLDSNWPLVADQNVENPVLVAETSNIAYVIYTSGSTGQPKGVLIAHNSLSTYAQTAARNFNLGLGDRVLQFASISFDASAEEIYPCLASGGTLVLRTEDMLAPFSFLRRSSDWGITVWDLPTAYWHELTSVLASGNNIDLPSSLRLVIIGGERALPERMAAWQKIAPERIRLVNTYGPTEATIVATACDVKDNWEHDSDDVSIGRAIGGTRTYIVDRSLNLTPVGVPGELCLGGVGLARGYLGHPELTAESFIPNPFSVIPGERIYRTGDLVRFRSNGNLEYLGRIDSQVKIRGFRIELGEIEAALAALPEVREAVVVAREDQAGTSKRLVAYLTAQAGHNLPETAVLRSRLAQSLPGYMIPSAFVCLERLPLTPNGKIDRRALPAPDMTRSETGYVAPRTSTEETLARIWAEVLKLDKVGVHDNFFELGGHSLLAITLIERMHRVGLAVDVRALFSTPTIADLAADAGVGGSEVEAPPNRIPGDCEAITPDMLPLVQLTPDEIAGIVKTVPGGARNIQDIYPLAPLQEGILFHHLMNQEGDAYLSPMLLGFDSRERLEHFVNALEHVIHRHDILRTAVLWDGVPEPVQVVWRQASISIEEILLDAEQGGIAEQLKARYDLRHTRLDVRKAPMLRGYIAEDRANNRWLLQILFHHLIGDHTTLDIVTAEIQAIMNGQEQDLPKPLPFRNFVAQARLGITQAEHEAFFTEMLSRVDEPTAPFGLLDVQGDGSGIEEAWREVDLALSKRLRRQARSLGVSPASLMHLAWAQVLARVSGQQDVVFGTVLFGRMQGGEGADRVMGMFINTLPVCIPVDEQSVQESVRQTHIRLTQLLRHEHASLALAQRCSGVTAPTPLFSAILNYRYTSLTQADPAAAQAWEGMQMLGTEERTNYPISLSIDDLGEGFSLNPQVVSSVGVGRICDYMYTTLEHLVQALETAPQTPANRIEVLPLAERRQLLVEWNATAAKYPHAARKCIHELFESQVEQTPSAVAVVFEDQQLTYYELNQRANQLAHYLRSQGVGPDAPVGICVERSLEMVVGLLGILKAGSAYVPLDPNYPTERLRFMLADSRSPVLLTQTTFLEHFPQPQATIICLDRDWPAIASESAESCVSAASSDTPAYIIYTSGSTGRPKGVVMGHRALVNLMNWQRANSTIDHPKTLQFTSLSFDVSCQEIFSTWNAGGTLILISETLRRDPFSLLDLITRQAVERIFLPFVALQNLAEAAQDAAQTPASLREVITAGEALRITAPIAKWFSKMDGCALYNQYGPSETHVVTAFTLQGQPETWSVFPPIGQPIANTQIYLLDAHLNPVPVGVPGELYIGGDGLACGYLNRPDLTAEKFIPNPFAEEDGPSTMDGETDNHRQLSTVNGRLYRTGDLARYLPDGNIEFLGRIDSQVKVRGFRIELGEIEAALAALPEVREAVVVAREGQSGTGNHLVAYLVAQAGHTLPGTAALRSSLAQSLPEYMIPSAFVCLERLPLTPNGKIDRRALPAPDMTRSETGYVAPRTPAEETLARIWAEVLKLDRVGVHDNFFELGGHSLLATQVVSRIRQALDAELPLRMLFQTPTVAGLAEQIQTLRLEKVLPLRPVPRTGPLPLSFAQQRLWFIDQFEPGSSFYNIPGALRLVGELDETALRRTLNEIVRRHESLRTRFVAVDGAPAQVIADRLELALPVVDLTHLVVAEREARAMQLAQDEAQTPFDLAAGPLVRAGLIRLDVTEHIVLFTMHHIVSDGWSIGVLVGEVAAIYAAFVQNQPVPLPELPIQYADFAHWQREWLNGEVLQRQIDYWTTQLNGSPTLLTLPTDRPRPAVETHHGATLPFEISAGTTAGLKALNKQTQTTLFMALAAAFDILLARYSGQDDICIGAPIANRNRAEIEALIGFFVNTLALRVQVDGTASFEELLQRVRAVTLDAYAHQDVPFEQLVGVLKPERHTSHSPLFQVMLALQNAPMGRLELPGLTLQPVTAENATAKFDLTLNITEADGQLFAAFEYNTDLFDRTTIERMIGHFTRLLDAIVANPAARIQDLTMLGADELRQLLIEWNATAAKYPHATRKCIHELFESQVEQTPGAMALVFEDQQLTYYELNQRANQLAHYLRSQGVGPDVLVGICVERSVEMVIGLLGILKAGGAYVPLDSHFPKDRLAFMLADSRLTILLTQTSLVDSLPEHTAYPIFMDRDWPAIANEAIANCSYQDISPDHLAYVIYTSGSTGKPKGVQVTQKAVVNFLTAMRREPGLTACDRLLSVTTLSFDIAGLELYLPLISGAVVEVTPREIAMDGFRLCERLKASHATIMQATPATWKLLLEAGWDENEPIKILCGGEALSPALARALLPHATSLWNLYGPTETTIWSSLARIQAIAPGNSPIGRPIANTQFYVLDRQLNPTPIGVPGELYIGGDGLARGYLNRPDLTAEKFIPDPFAEGGRLYKTGDLARYLPASRGDIEFVGRVDHQVKVHGFRIELGEIEIALTALPEVREAVVVVREDKNGNKRLVAYVVTASEAKPTVDDLRNSLKTTLPQYMLPSNFVFLEHLPLTPNGKVDRKALPAPQQERQNLATGFAPPRNAIEETLAQIWADVLGVKQVGIYDNFFELGGDSMLSLHFIALIHQAGLDLDLRQIFQRPTIAELAEVVNTTPVFRPEHHIITTGFGPLAPNQYWFFEQNFPGQHHFNGAMFFETSSHLKLEPALVKEIVRSLEIHHEALRMRFIQDSSEWRQFVAAFDEEIPFSAIDLSALPDQEQTQAIEKIANETQTSLRLSEGPLLRVVLFNLGDHKPDGLLIIIHHLVTDGFSYTILTQDILTAYEQLSLGQTIQLPPKTTPFHQWCERLVEYAQSPQIQQELQYWQAIPGETLPGLPLFDYPNPSFIFGSAYMVSGMLGQEETRILLQDVLKTHDMQLIEVMLAVLAETLGQAKGERSLFVDILRHGRDIPLENVDLSRTVGWFVIHYPLLLRLESAGSLEETLPLVRQQYRQPPNGGIGDELLRYMSGNDELKKTLRPHPKLIFSHESSQSTSADKGPIRSVSTPTGNFINFVNPEISWPYLLELRTMIVDNQLHWAWTSGETVYHRSTVEQLSKNFGDILKKLCCTKDQADMFNGY